MRKIQNATIDSGVREQERWIIWLQSGNLPFYALVCLLIGKRAMESIGGTCYYYLRRREKDAAR